MLLSRLRFHKQKVVFACALLLSFSAGFAAAWLRGRAAGAYITNHTPPLPHNQQKQATIDATCPIKAKRKRSGRSYYHLPGDSAYKRLKATDCFTSEAAAHAAGFVKAKSLY